jgi:hypothetical protein
LALAYVAEKCHIAASRHCGLVLCGVVALSGRFLPELGRSLGSGLFLLLEIARERAQMIGKFGDGSFPNGARRLVYSAARDWRGGF